MLRHAYEATTLSRQYRAAPLPAVALAKAGRIRTKSSHFLKNDTSKNFSKGKPKTTTNGSARHLNVLRM